MVKKTKIFQWSKIGLFMTIAVNDHFSFDPFLGKLPLILLTRFFLGSNFVKGSKINSFANRCTHTFGRDSVNMTTTGKKKTELPSPLLPRYIISSQNTSFSIDTHAKKCRYLTKYGLRILLSHPRTPIPVTCIRCTPPSTPVISTCREYHPRTPIPLRHSVNITPGHLYL